MLTIGFRTLKTALGTGISLLVAQELLSLQYFVSAGILTILCIQPTKRRSITTAFSRATACVVGMLTGVILFTLLGYHWFTIILLFLLLIPILVQLKIQEGLLTSTVIIFHLYLEKHFSLAFLWNELQLIGVGVGVALVMNLYMPSKEKKLLAYRQQIDRNIQRILKELGIFIQEGDTMWSGKEFMETAEWLAEAKDLSLQTVENDLLWKKDEHYLYFHMRERQFERLERMLPLVSSVDLQVKQVAFVSDLFSYLSQHLHDNPRATYNHVQEVRKVLKEMDLPQTREEFESRALLYTLLNEMEQFILIHLEFA
ncbi:aromatic acid exporter family protein [Ammoniphilus sp. YIM 78166]|uniref:aromatic acid exporter family protein n=1 Tax=Ammoniphilus sp. YIM 78166 TaxID=1644106 RepID=UPI001431EE78|nr:aromatic acid exporter family protein [Ammoniphilus sp. YIM 78166]